MSITPGPAALAFGSVVVLTMLAAMTFDPRLIWDTSPPHRNSLRHFLLRRKAATKEPVDG